jgi:4-hydroxy-3-methylbut-2-enyl diphosphate reductase
VDATCPIVRKSQKVAQRLQEAGFQVIIYGDQAHPEVRAILAWTNGHGCALEDPEAPLATRRRKVALPLPDHQKREGLHGLRGQVHR